MVAGLGPAIAADRYQVGAEVADAAERAFADRTPDVLRATGPGQWQFDLWAANRLVLQDAGVPAAQIHVADVPTGPGTCLTPGAPPVPGIRRTPDGGWFFSHRSEKPCGRFAALARLRPTVPAGNTLPG